MAGSGNQSQPKETLSWNLELQKVDAVRLQKKLVANGAHAVCLQKYFEVEVDIFDGWSALIWHR